MSLIFICRKMFFYGIKEQSGSLIPAFAVLLPLLLIVLALGLNGANVLSQKARLSDAMSESSLAISSIGNFDMNSAEIIASTEFINQYIRYYLPEIIKKPNIKIFPQEQIEDEKSGIKYINYKFSAEVVVPVALSVGNLPGFNQKIEIGTHNKIRKYSSVPADYVFVVDFSTSQAGAPLRRLKRVVKEVSDFALKSNNKSRIAIVPFSTGVSVKLPGKNERGGDRIGCSVLFVPTKNYNINYQFWADKHVGNYSSRAREMYYMDYYRYYYFYNYVRPSSPAFSLSNMREKWCTYNASSGVNVGKYTYSCKNDDFAYSDIFSAESQKLIQEEYSRALAVQKKQGSLLTIEHDEAIDYPATLEKIFSEDAIITFPLSWSAMSNSHYRAYSNMCHQGGWYHHVANNDLSRASARAWLIELTNDLGKLDEFQHMLQQGWTHISSGLIRSVPVMMKGRNTRKVFILLSDGGDSAGPAKVTDKWLKKYNLCEKIQQGIIERTETNAKKVEIYYISTTTSPSRIRYWADYCVGPDRSVSSTSENGLIKVIKGIMSDETGHFAG